MKHKTLSFLLAVLMSMTASTVSAYDFMVNGIYYRLNYEGWTDRAMVTYYDASSLSSNKYAYSGDVVIPENVKYNGIVYRVTSIDMSAFLCCSELTSVTIPNSVASIGDGAFRYCTGLTSVVIPESVEVIGAEAFYGCSSLESITIPDLVTDIMDCAFAYCI